MASSKIKMEAEENTVDDLKQKVKKQTTIFAYRKMKRNSKSPRRKNIERVGWVCFAAESAIIRAGERKQISLGFEVEHWPEGTYGRLVSRPCLALHYGVEVGGGLLEPDFHDEVKVLLFNHGKGSFVVRKGKKICLLVFEKVLTMSTFGGVEVRPPEKDCYHPSTHKVRHEFLSSDESGESTGSESEEDERDDEVDSEAETECEDERGPEVVQVEEIETEDEPLDATVKREVKKQRK
jgi:dUTPase